MKKLCLSLFALLISTSLFAQNINILDYFPVKEGYKWEYVNKNGKVQFVNQCVSIKKDSITGTYPINVTFIGNQYGKTTERISWLWADSIAYLIMSDGYISLKNLDGKIYECGDDALISNKVAIVTTINFNGKTHDCILVRTGIISKQLGKGVIITEYYAKNIGLIFYSFTSEVDKNGDPITEEMFWLSSKNF